MAELRERRRKRHSKLGGRTPVPSIFLRARRWPILTLRTHEKLLSMQALSVFRMPTAVTITGRTSTITNSFVNAIIPIVVPSEAEVLEALAVLEQTPKSIHCAYCGNPTTEWDHFRPLVRKKRPTGFISEIANLVPACGKCNQSKSGHDWHIWITGSATQSPTTRRVPDLARRIQLLQAFEAWRTPTIVDFAAVVPDELWAQHWDNHDRIHALMREYQEIAEQVRLEALRAVRA